MKLNLSIVLAILLVGSHISCVSQSEPPYDARPRIIAMPDFGADPDDDQSLVRLLVSSNEFEIEGLINVTSCWIRNQSSADAFDPFMEAYEQVYPNLLEHADGYPTVEHLRSVIRLGQQNYGMEDVGEGKDSPGSELIIEVVDRPDPRPVWVLFWGGGNTLAQAIWKVRETRTPEEFSEFLSKIRVYDILGQDDAGAWMAKNFPDLFYIRAKDQVYGWQLGKEMDNVWLRENIQPKGPLGAVYPEVIWALEGDTPSYLHVYPNGLNDPEQVDQGGWGGRFSTEKKAGIRGMTESEILDNEGDYDPYYMYTDAPGEREAIRRFSDAIQNDFIARMIWSITDNYADANHHPVAIVNGDRSRRIIEKSVPAGTSVTLDAAESYDPDGDSLEYSWFVYEEPGSYEGDVIIENNASSTAWMQIPPDAGGKDIHVILELRDTGTPQLYAYRRVILSVQ